jgi:hypothetical protein
VRHCKNSLKTQLPITFGGVTDQGQTMPFTGVVTSIDRDLLTDRDRWQITMDQLHS